MGYEAELDYELEMLRALEGKQIPSLEDEAFDALLKRAFVELRSTMSKEHFELVVAELGYSNKSREEMERLKAERKAYGKYFANAKYPTGLLSRLTLRFKKMVWRRALGDQRPLMLPPEVVQVYLNAKTERVILGEFECASCGFETPYLQRSGNLNILEKFSCCPVCGCSLAWWPDNQWTREAWSEANPGKSVDVYVWPNGSMSYDKSLRKRASLRA
jgi:hypothetical protein